jgi:SAM-dependent methyltransferase
MQFNPLSRRITRALGVLTDQARVCATFPVYWLASGAPERLGPAELETLQARYPFRTSYRYDAQTIFRRGMARAMQLLELPGARTARRFLEIACSAGMGSASLGRAGKAAIAVDLRRRGFDPRALEARAHLAQMDATSLGLTSASVDYAFSYNAFEHFAAPDRVLREMIRVVRPGGYIYLQFGPLYHSPWGQHAYRTITVPYCQFLFPRTVLEEFTERNGLHPIDFGHVNGWSVRQYRKLWKELERELDRVLYREKRDLSCLAVIKEHPLCFKAMSVSFDDFVVSHITALFRKRNGGAAS